MWLDNTELFLKRKGIMSANRAHDTVRYYVGSPSVLSIEFSVSCKAETFRTDFSDLCGCIPENDNILYRSEFGSTCG